MAKKTAQKKAPTLSLKDLKPDPENPRTITKEALDGLEVSEREFGDISGIVWNERTDQMVCGHQRLKALKQAYGDKLTMKRNVIHTPDGHAFPVRIVDWPVEKQRAANLAANHPGISGDWTANATAQLERIREESAELYEGLNFDGLLERLDNLKGEFEDDAQSDSKSSDEEIYTTKISAPIYEPKGDCPPIEDLIDREKTRQLISEINEASLPDEISDFLKLAAERHTSFIFSKIAEYYCHATPEVQDLMERSGLVIIDFDKAIEYGFVHMTERLMEIADKEDEENENA